MEPNRLHFFDDIKEKLFPFLLGLVSVYTVIPLFIGELATVFHFQVVAGYTVFVFLYFLFPLIFYLLYCSIHEYIGFMKLLPATVYRWKPVRTGAKWIEAGFILVVFLFLRFAWSTVANIGVGLLILATLLCFYRCWAIREEGANRRIYKEEKKEFRIISSTILFLFLLFFWANRSDFENSFDNDLSTDLDTVVETDKANEQLSRLLAETQKWKRHFYSRSMTVLGQNPDTTVHLKKLDTDSKQAFNIIAEKLQGVARSGFAIDTMPFRYIGFQFRKVDSLLNRAGHTDTSLCYKAFEASYYLHEYAQLISSDKRKETSEAWHTLIVGLQFKGLTWLLFLLISTLCLWLIFQGEYNYREEDAKRKKGQPDAEEAAQLLVKEKDNINQVKTFFYISLLLVLPFFKKIDAKDIDIDKPFLTTRLPDLLNTKKEYRGNGLQSDDNLLDELRNINHRMGRMATEQQKLNEKMDSSHSENKREFRDTRKSVDDQLNY